MPIPAPKPCPPVAARPRKLGASRIETLIANPYAIFAERICGLEKLAPLGHQPDAALRGMIVHEALSRFAQRFPHDLPVDIAGEVMKAANDFFDDLNGSPRVRAFWRPRLERFASWFAETEPARRGGVTGQLSEVNGGLTIEAPAGPFELTARADRIDLSPQGIVITDYKTGTLPTATEVKAGRKPQLPLEAAIALAHGFGPLQAEDDGELYVAALRYIKATGGMPAGEEKTVLANDVAAVAQQCFANLVKLIARFDDPATPYAALRRAGFDYRYDDYAQLARVDEWSAGDGGEEGGQ